VSSSTVISMPVASRPSSLISFCSAAPSSVGSYPPPNSFLPLPLTKLHKPIVILPFFSFLMHYLLRETNSNER
jgi:hypothetical protein